MAALSHIDCLLAKQSKNLMLDAIKILTVVLCTGKLSLVEDSVEIEIIDL